MKIDRTRRAPPSAEPSGGRNAADDDGQGTGNPSPATPAKTDPPVTARPGRQHHGSQRSMCAACPAPARKNCRMSMQSGQGGTCLTAIDQRQAKRETARTGRAMRFEMAQTGTGGQYKSRAGAGQQDAGQQYTDSAHPRAQCRRHGHHSGREKETSRGRSRSGCGPSGHSRSVRRTDR